MSFKNNDIVTLLCVNGEFIGRLECDGQLDTTSGTVTLNKPKMLVQQGESLGFAQGVALSAEEDAESVTFYSGGIVMMANADKKFVDGWKEVTKTIQLAGV